MPIKLADKLKGIWLSTEEIEVLDYNSNFSNWIGAIPIKGIFRFVVKETSDNYQVQILIPISNDGYFAIYSGRFDNKRNKILIWQNEKVPVEILYKWQEDLIELKLFDRRILFKKTTE